MIDVVAIGELLIDFTPAGFSQQGNVIFERNPGGAPANVLAAVTKLGGSGAFIGTVGNDQFGNYLKGVLEENNIQTKGLNFSKEADTTLAFVHLDEKGDRSFSFYRRPGADTMLSEEDIDFSIIDNAKVFHFGSLSMTTEPSRNATLKAVEYAKKNGCIISYDPNYRPMLWENEGLARQWMAKGIKYADILKLSDIELEIITGTTDMKKGCEVLISKGVKLIAVTLGANGCYYKFSQGDGQIATYDTKVIDTTGAGDAFLGGLLYKIRDLGKDVKALNQEEIIQMIDFANAVGALCASKRGAIPAMPSLEEVDFCVKHIPKLHLS
jgi:fructokinase